MPSWLAEVLRLLLGGAVIGALGAVFGWRVRKRRSESASSLDEIKALDQEAVTAKYLAAENEELRTQCREMERQRDSANIARETLERLIPDLLVGDQMKDFDGITKLYDRARDGWTLTVPDGMGGAKFFYASASFCDSLGMTQDEFLACDYLKMILPEFIDSTKRAESSAWGLDVTNFKNQWRGKRGCVEFSWNCRPYAPMSGTLAVILITPLEAA